MFHSVEFRECEPVHAKHIAAFLGSFTTRKLPNLFIDMPDETAGSYEEYQFQDYVKLFNDKTYQGTTDNILDAKLEHYLIEFPSIGEIVSGKLDLKPYDKWYASEYGGEGEEEEEEEEEEMADENEEKTTEDG